MPPQPVRSASPPSWLPNGGLVIPAGVGYSGVNPVQIFPQQEGRDTVVISNVGANSCVVLAGNGQQSVTGFTVAAGGVLSLDTEGEVWVASSGGTTLDLLATYWPKTGSNVAPLGDITGALKG